MMGVNKEKQHQFMLFNLEDYIPANHLLRSIEKVVDFSFIYKKVQHLYSPIGRKTIDPVMLIKMLLLGYLYGIPSERKLGEQVQLNLEFRWFLGLGLEESIPDHSTLSQNRRRRFKERTIFQEIFDHIVSTCVSSEPVTGEVIVTDSTHIKAHASDYQSEKVWKD
ncbi:transposase [Paenibacillus sp. 481]|uniref:transposase n=1 Tax=Paenibacillus sp. 481 TaxID=2835869 RepID=UPI001E3B4801|nr:transposase [Paenibacillus sp. 481]UHA71912.1 transposase [Paenibacillus sp. 481]